MTTHQPPTTKIFVCIGALILTLLALLFIPRLNNKPSVLMNTAEGILFNTPRELKPFKLLGSNGESFTRNNLLHHWTIMVFGFTHCKTVCPANLAMLSRVYPALHKEFPNLQIALVSIDPERDSQKTLAAYTHSFHPDFVGLTGPVNELHQLQAQLGISAMRESGTHSQKNYNIEHTPSLLLINPQGKWAGLFHYGLNPAQFITAFRNSMSVAPHA